MFRMSYAAAIAAGVTFLAGSVLCADDASEMGAGGARGWSQLGMHAVPNPAEGAVAGLLPCEYAVDDGTGENGLGSNTGGTVVWANAFQTVAGCEQITTVRVAWFSGAFTANAPAKVYVYDDPDNDGNPDDAVLLAIADVTTSNESTDTFNDYAIGPVTVNGTFFVGASITHQAGQFPARYDNSSPSEMRSWIGVNPTDPNDPLASTFLFLSDNHPNSNFAGNYMVRAIAMPTESPCPTDLDGNGSTDVDDLIAVILDWGCSTAKGPCPADIDGNGIVDVDDLVAVILAWGACPVLNDLCADALTVFGGTLIGAGECMPQATAFSNVNAQTKGSAFSCNFEASADVWFDYTATCDGTLTIDTIGSDFDTVLEVYPTHFCPPDDVIDCDDDAAPDGVRSLLELDVKAGDEFKIRVGGGLVDAQGSGILNICCAETLPPPPANDTCATAQLLAPAPGGSVTLSAQTLSANADPDAFSCPTGFEVTAPGVWYEVVGTGRNFTASFCADGTDFDTVVRVYCGPCDELKCIGADDDGCGNAGGPSELTWCTELDRQYFVFVSGFAGTQGNFEMTLSQSNAMCAPADVCMDPVVLVNDACADAIPIGNGLTPYSTLQATTDGPAHLECQTDGDGGETGNDIWFLYTADCPEGSGLLRVTTCEDLGGSADYDTDLVLYDPSLVKGPVCENLASALVACNDDDTNNPCGGLPTFRSTLLAQVVDGQQYLLRVGGFGPGQDGNGELLIECGPASDDVCGFAADILPDETLQIDTCAATVDELAPVCGTVAPPSEPGRWLRVTGTGAEMTISLCNLNDESFPDTRLFVYCGPCEDLECVADEPIDNNGECVQTESLTWCTAPGQAYYVLVHGAGDPGCGIIDVTLTEGAACDDPPCQGCVTCDAKSLVEGEPCYVDGDSDTFNAGCNISPASFGLTLAPGDTVCGTTSKYFDPAAGIEVRDTDWYVFTPSVSGTYTWSVVAEFPANIIIAQLSGPAGMPACPVVPGSNIGTFGQGDCIPANLVREMTAGANYVLFVSTQQVGVGPDVPCGGAISNTYEATLTGP